MIRSAIVSLCVLVVAATLGACAEEPTEPRPGESFTLAPGESVLLEAAALRVGFRKIGSDSRCPLRAECVWAGDGTVVLELAPLDGAETEDTLHTNTAVGPGSVDLGRFELALVALHPHPEVPGGIEPEDYRVTLVLNDRGEQDSP